VWSRRFLLTVNHSDKLRATLCPIAASYTIPIELHQSSYRSRNINYTMVPAAVIYAQLLDCASNITVVSDNARVILRTTCPLMHIPKSRRPQGKRWPSRSCRWSSAMDSHKRDQAPRMRCRLSFSSGDLLSRQSTTNENPASRRGATR
jgi:hypothetical protein